MAINIDFDFDTIVLPIYKPIWSSTADIDLLYGGRDSGKSQFVAMRLIFECINADYFRCVLVRKVFNTIKESQYQTIKDIVNRWSLSDFFTFNENPLQIICLLNGNRFICRGLDDAANLKSLANPSHAWGEEFNQATWDDFVLLISSLRVNEGRAKTYLTFNPEAVGDYQKFWIYTNFYAKAKNPYTRCAGTWKVKLTLDDGTEEIVRYRYTSTWSTYKDNRYCRAERRAFLELMKDKDPYYYTTYTLGKWGNRKVNDPFCYSFDPGRHIGRTKPDRRYELILSFDFNVNPITCGVYQNQGGSVIHPKIRGIQSIKLSNSNIYAICDYILKYYPGYLYIITGDATGRNTSALVQDQINYYTVIKAKFNIGSGQIKVPTINPDIKENRVLLNTIFLQHDIVLDEVNCADLIFDCKNVATDDLGKIDKGDRANPVKRADHLDHLRYMENQFFKAVLKNQ